MEHEVLVENLGATQCQDDPGEYDYLPRRHYTTQGHGSGKASARGRRRALPSAALAGGALAVEPPGVDLVLLIDLLLLVAGIGLVWAWLTGRLPRGARHGNGESRAGKAGKAAEGTAAEEIVEEVPAEENTAEDAAADAAAVWRAEAAALARDVQAVADTDDTIADTERLARQLVPLSAELKAHARDAPPAVEARTVEQVFALGTDCYEIGMEHTPSLEARTGEFFEDRLARLQADAATLEGTVDS